MLRIRLEPAWRVGPAGKDPLDPLLFRLLDSIREMGTLAQAARVAGLSYRHAWNQMGEWERLFGHPLAKFERGRGAHLTTFGERLLWAEQQVNKRLESPLAQLSAELERDLGQLTADATMHLVIHASHDLALAQLRELPAATDGLKLEMHFHGSLENLVALTRDRCDLAGFHVAEQANTPEFSRLLKPDLYKLIGVCIREQGLMVACGNPKGIHGLRDLTRRGMRLVNRQQGSGTRIVFDQLLDAAGIDRGQIDGYQTEEFTHLAVAAIIASGKADMGFGIHAAAAQHSLGFIPMISERYLFACRNNRTERPEMRRFLQFLRGPRFREMLSKLPGYDDAITGRVMEVEAGLQGPRPAKSRSRVA